MIALTSLSSPVLAVSGFFGCTLACISIVLPGYVKPLGWMDERCFRPLLCTVKAELGRGQPGLMSEAIRSSECGFVGFFLCLPNSFNIDWNPGTGTTVTERWESGQHL